MTGRGGESDPGGRPRALVVAARPPWPPYTGDRLRTCVWVEALAPHADVTLIAPPPALPIPSPHRRVVLEPAGMLLPGHALRALRRRWPLTSLLAAGRAWRAAFDQAGRGGSPFDVTVVVLARTHPWVAPHLRSPRRILDAIDSLAANLSERARAAAGPARWFWRREAARTARLEEEVLRFYHRVTVVAEEESVHFSGPVAVAGHGVELWPEGNAPRDIDFAFWGRLEYFANRDAALLLLRELWPAIRARLPHATLVVAGADCPPALRRFDGRDGVRVVSPMEDRPALLRRVRVALFPVRYGSGQPNKVLEAAEASCAIASTPAGTRGTGPLAEAVVVAPLEGLAEAAVALSREGVRCAELGRRARQLVAAHFDRRAALARFAHLAGVGPAR